MHAANFEHTHFSLSVDPQIFSITIIAHEKTAFDNSFVSRTFSRKFEEAENGSSQKIIAEQPTIQVGPQCSPFDDHIPIR